MTPRARGVRLESFIVRRKDTSKYKILDE